VRDSATPVPSSEPFASSVQLQEQGDAEHAEDDPSNATGDPDTGEDGLQVKAETGGPLIMNEPALVADPPGVVTLSGPVVAAAGTVAWIAVAELRVKLALTPLNRTAVAPVKFVPLMVTLAPAEPLAGVKLVIAGAGALTG
jgi:hypothetical protein